MKMNNCENNVDVDVNVKHTLRCIDQVELLQQIISGLSENKYTLEQLANSPLECLLTGKTIPMVVNSGGKLLSVTQELLEILVTVDRLMQNVF